MGMVCCLPDKEQQIKNEIEDKFKTHPVILHPTDDEFKTHFPNEIINQLPENLPTNQTFIIK